MPNISDLYPSKYLKSSDIKGHEPTVVIASLEVEEIGKGEHKPILRFQNKQKGMVLNRTNADAITEFLGPDYDHWIGREVTLYVARVQGPNGITDGLRVKAPTRRQPAGNGQPQRGRLEVEDRGGYKTSSMKPANPIEDMTGHPTRDPDGEEIPF